MKQSRTMFCTALTPLILSATMLAGCRAGGRTDYPASRTNEIEDGQDTNSNSEPPEENAATDTEPDAPAPEGSGDSEPNEAGASPSAGDVSAPVVGLLNSVTTRAQERAQDRILKLVDGAFDRLDQQGSGSKMRNQKTTPPHDLVKANLSIQKRAAKLKQSDATKQRDIHRPKPKTLGAKLRLLEKQRRPQAPKTAGRSNPPDG